MVLEHGITLVDVIMIWVCNTGRAGNLRHVLCKLYAAPVGRSTHTASGHEMQARRQVKSFSISQSDR